MTIQEIKTPEDVLTFMKNHIKYGWLDYEKEPHIGNMKNFRRLYRTSSIEETLAFGIGTCIEQVFLMHQLLDNIGISNKMYCTRIYEGKDFNNLDAEEHMHCFILCFISDKIIQIEHPNVEKIGIYEYSSEEKAIEKIQDYYIRLVDGQKRDLTEFFDVQPGLSFKEFNEYINQLDIKKTKC